MCIDPTCTRSSCRRPSREHTCVPPLALSPFTPPPSQSHPHPSPVNNSREHYRFQFDGVLLPDAKQDEVFARAAHPLVGAALDGWGWAGGAVHAAAVEDASHMQCVACHLYVDIGRNAAVYEG